MGTGLWQDGADQQVFHCLFILTFARCLSILVESSSTSVHSTYHLDTHVVGFVSSLIGQINVMSLVDSVMLKLL